MKCKSTDQINDAIDYIDKAEAIFKEWDISDS